ncbi:MAG: shikimate dehydrogenase [Anaerolineales bacterium]|nr:shikimate dehydrogenase [Anaerolineales bacterium]
MAYRFGLLGYPLTYSLSPLIHRVFLEESGLQGSYELLPIAVDERTEERLRAAFEKMRQGEYDGLNVTIPHKQAVKPLLDVLDNKARTVGAVNTIYRNGQALFGTNTDVEGFLLDVGQKISLAQGGTALILGAGGAARAVAYGLLGSGWHVWIAARRPQQAEQIVRDLASSESFQGEASARMRAYSFHELDFVRAGVENLRLVVNATPLGTKGLEDGSPLPPEIKFPQDACFYDLVYNPPETTFLRQAREQGHEAWNGFGMLIQQAALAFECWTGYKMTVTAEIESKIIARIQQSHD